MEEDSGCTEFGPIWDEFVRKKKYEIIQNLWNQLKMKYRWLREPLDVLAHIATQKSLVPRKKRKLPRSPRYPRSGFCSVDREFWPANPDLSSDSD